MLITACLSLTLFFSILNAVFAQDPDPDKRPVDKPIQPPGETLNTQCPDGFTYNKETRLCETDPVLTCAEPSEPNGDACQTEELRDPQCGGGTHLSDDNTKCLNDFNNADSGIQPVCVLSGYETRQIDGAWYCYKVTYSDPSVPTCDVGSYNSDTGKCEVKPTKGNR